jgi:hypothetical protein
MRYFEQFKIFLALFCGKHQIIYINLEALYETLEEEFCELCSVIEQLTLNRGLFEQIYCSSIPLQEKENFIILHNTSCLIPEQKTYIAQILQNMLIIFCVVI